MLLTVRRKLEKKLQVVTAPLPNAVGSTSICKQSPFGKDIYFALQMSINIVSLFKHFGRQCFKTALGKAPKR